MSVDEVAGLAISFGVMLGELLDPTLFGLNRTIVIGTNEGTVHVLSPTIVSLAVRSRILLRYVAEDDAGLIIELAHSVPSLITK